MWPGGEERRSSAPSSDAGWHRLGRSESAASESSAAESEAGNSDAAFLHAHRQTLASVHKEFDRLFLKSPQQAPAASPARMREPCSAAPVRTGALPERAEAAVVVGPPRRAKVE